MTRIDERANTGLTFDPWTEDEPYWRGIWPTSARSFTGVITVGNTVRASFSSSLMPFICASIGQPDLDRNDAANGGSEQQYCEN